MSWNERPWADENFRGGPKRFGDNPLNWAPTIARVAGIRVRLHMLFILFIFFELITAGSALPFRAQYLLVLFVSVFLHELGHCFAARRMGGSAEDVLMWPLGGLATVDAPRSPWPQFVTVVCGPLVNLALLGLAAAAQGLNVSPNPFEGWSPVSASWGNPGTWLTLIFKVNLVLFLFNLWPMYPMDGGRMLQCGLWRWMGMQRGMALTASIGMVAAIVLGMYGLMETKWLLFCIAIMGYIACLQERQMLAAGAYGEEFGDFAYSALEPAGGPRRRRGWFSEWRRKRDLARRRREHERAESLQREVDRILDKVHQQGLHSLTRAERQALEVASRLQQESHRRQF